MSKYQQDANNGINSAMQTLTNAYCFNAENPKHHPHCQCCVSKEDDDDKKSTEIPSEKEIPP